MTVLDFPYSPRTLVAPGLFLPQDAFVGPPGPLDLDGTLDDSIKTTLPHDFDSISLIANPLKPIESLLIDLAMGFVLDEWVRVRRIEK